MLAAAAVAEELRNFASAALFGARMVILDNVPNETREGCVPRRPIRALREAFWEPRASVRLWAEAIVARATGKSRLRSMMG
jgi:hypothetical protein